MDPRRGQRQLPFRLAQAAGLALAISAAQGQTPPAAAAAQDGWQPCASLADDRDARLACFDQWARQQQGAATAAPPARASAQPAPTQAPPVDASIPATRVISVAAEPGCQDRQYSELARFWELETGASCDTLGIRGYRPVSLSLIGSDSVNRQPGSDNPLNNAASTQPYRVSETRIQLSVRTKILQSLLTQGQPSARDSLWFGYTQQSYWQLFTPQISRPFRSTDHEPEIIYVYPTDAHLPGGWRLRYSGVGLVHQSNGQSLPLSRSWNRVYLMSGMELGHQWRVQGRIWQRLPEKRANDDNPGISDYVGRAELATFWSPNPDNTLGLTLRHTLRSEARGSVRLEWLRAIGNGARPSGSLRFHTQLFSGWGDSLLDYNRRRNVLSVGLSLVDF